MAEATVTNAAERESVVFDATWEIQLAAKALQKFIEATDSGGTIHPVSRGVLLRLEVLSDAIHCAVNEADLDVDCLSLETAKALIDGRKRVGV